MTRMRLLPTQNLFSPPHFPGTRRWFAITMFAHRCVPSGRSEHSPQLDSVYSESARQQPDDATGCGTPANPAGTRLLKSPLSRPLPFWRRSGHAPPVRPSAAKPGGNTAPSVLISRPQPHLPLPQSDHFGQSASREYARTNARPHGRTFGRASVRTCHCTNAHSIERANALASAGTFGCT